MVNSAEFWEKPQAEEIYLLAGWRQWADGGSVSSGLPRYIIEHNGARPIGTLPQEGYYLFQFPGTHDLVRPVVKFKDGYPEDLITQHNDYYYFGDQRRGLVIFIGDEPQLNVEAYTQAFLQGAQVLGVKRIISLGGVYGELPYDKERMVACIYSLPELRNVVRELAVNLSDYHGGASIGSYICKRAGERSMELIGMYAFAPLYDLSNIAEGSNSLRIENDFMAWLGVMRRVNHLCKLNLDLSDLEKRSRRLIELMDSKVEELDKLAPQLGVREYFRRLSSEFNETVFEPLDELWEDEIRRLLDKFDEDQS